MCFLRFDAFVDVKNLRELLVVVDQLHISNNGSAPTHIPQHTLTHPHCRYCSGRPTSLRPFTGILLFLFFLIVSHITEFSFFRLRRGPSRLFFLTGSYVP